ncbi:hypothetical protein BD560DRAFT_452161 [Blakeslea trispora]|nr:hypothetical protein BD560DRAFT_452161 [Blakeslea trispora]
MSEEVQDQIESVNQKSVDPHAKLTLFVRGLPFDATNQDLEDFFGDIGPVRKCFVVTDKSSEGQFRNKGFGYVHYALEEDAQAAIDKLKNTKFKGKKLRIELAKRKSETHHQDQPEETEKKPKKVERTDLQFDVNARLIVRNLPWKYRESDLRKLFEKYGTVHDVKLPRKYEGGPLRGFAFIQFETVEQGQAAMDGLNATEHHGRTIAVDWSISKTQYRQVEEKEAEEEEDVEMKEAEKESSDKEDIQAKNASDTESSDEESDSDSSAEDSDDDSDSNEDSEEEEEEVKTKETKPPKKTGPSTAEGTTLFIRNLLFESTEEDLKQLLMNVILLGTRFTQWGPVVYAKITRDPITKLSRGTGFVCMRKKEDVDTILEAAEALRAISQKDENNDSEAMNQLLSKREKKKKGLMFKSIITPESTSGEGAKFTLHGRVLDVTLAVDREQAKQIKDDNLSQKRKEDKRNLYLMREGVVFPDSPAAATMTPSELSKRQMSFSSRKKLISSNPSLFISKTRLSIRNLPIKITDTELRQLGISSIAKFKNQVKANERADLSKDEKAEGWQYLPRVKQAKIIRSKDRIDTSTNQLRSKGYGFLEFTTHAHALAALRYLNNNPDLFDGKRLIVEFSLENKDVVERRQQKTTDDKPKDASQGRKRSYEDRDDKKDFKKPRMDRKQQGRPQQGRPQQGRPQQGRPQQGRPQQGRPQQGRPQQGRPQQKRFQNNHNNKRMKNTRQ